MEGSEELCENKKLGENEKRSESEAWLQRATRGEKTVDERARNAEQIEILRRWLREKGTLVGEELGVRRHI